MMIILGAFFMRFYSEKRTKKYHKFKKVIILLSNFTVLGQRRLMPMRLILGKL